MVILVLKNLQLEKLSETKQWLIIPHRCSVFFPARPSLALSVCASVPVVVIPARMPSCTLFSLPPVFTWLNMLEYPFHVKAEFRLWGPFWRKKHKRNVSCFGQTRAALIVSPVCRALCQASRRLPEAYGMFLAARDRLWKCRKLEEWRRKQKSLTIPTPSQQLINTAHPSTFTESV